MNSAKFKAFTEKFHHQPYLFRCSSLKRIGNEPYSKSLLRSSHRSQSFERVTAILVVRGQYDGRVKYVHRHHREEH
jgi:hypothetical protein